MGGTSRARSLILTALAALSLAGCASGPDYGTPRAPHYALGRPHYTVAPYQIDGVWYYPKVDYSYDVTGTASWYGPGFDHRATADGEIYDMNGMSAAHKTLPLPSVVDVTNLQNGRELRLRVNDRGPFIGDRLIDVSRRAAQLLGFERNGTTQVRVRVVKDDSIAVAEAAMLGEMGPVGVGIASAGEPAARTRLAEAVPPATAPPPPASRPSFPLVAQVGAPPPEPAQYAAAPPPPPTPAPVQYAAAEPPPPQPTAVRQAPAPAPRRDYWPSLIAPAHAAPFYRPPPPPSRARPAPVIVARRIFVQAGAFSVAGNARFVRAQLASLGGAAEIVPIRDKGIPLYRVRLGPVASEAEARLLLRKVVDHGFVEARLVDR